MLLQFQNKTNIKSFGFWLMYFGFALDLSDIDLWDVDLLDADLALLDRISLINILFVSKTSSTLRQRNNFSSSKTSFRLKDRKVFS